MLNKRANKKCQYSQRKCYFDAEASSKYCSLHEENGIKCRYICPSTHVQCNCNRLENSAFCKAHKEFLNRNRARYHSFEQKYCGMLPAHKRENDVDFIEEQLHIYTDHARYVDLLSRPAALNPVANTGVYSLSEIENIRNAMNGILISRLQETRNLYEQRAHAVAYALDEEIKEHKKNNEKFMIVTNSSAETAVALQSLIDDHERKIKELPVPDKNDLLHPAQRQTTEIVVDDDMNGYDNSCYYSEIRRNVETSSILKGEKNEPIEKAVKETMNFILNYLEREPEPIAYIHERLCTNKKIKGFNHCFKHLWKEAPALKKCIECGSTCTLASNVCGKCLKPYIDVKTENMVVFSDDDEDIPTVSIGTTDNDLNAVFLECAKKLKDTVEDDKDSDLEIASPHKYDTKNLSDQKRLQFTFADMLQFGVECDNVVVPDKEIKAASDAVSSPSLPSKYNRLYDIDEMIAKPSDNEPPQPEAEKITFCKTDERKPMVLRFPTKTLSEKVTSHLDKSPTIALAVEDASQLPVQFRPVSAHQPPPVVNTVPQQSQPRPTYYSPATANTIRLIRNVNPAARSNHQFMYGSNIRQGPSTSHHYPRSSIPYARPSRFLRPNPQLRYVYDNVSYIPSSVTYSSSIPSSSYPQSYDAVGPSTGSFVYYTNTPPLVHQRPTFTLRQPLPRQS